MGSHAGHHLIAVLLLVAGHLRHLLLVTRHLVLVAVLLARELLLTGHLVLVAGHLLLTG